jgi:hypothetical protein
MFTQARYRWSALAVALMAVVPLGFSAVAARTSAVEPQSPPSGQASPPGAQRGQGSQPAPAQPAQGRGTFGPSPRQPDDTAGFTSIFDGATLNGWDGDPMFWRVEDGAIVGESTPQKVVKENTFLIWRGGTLRDFELKVEFRINGTNSGIQYRSAELPSVGKWVLKGYQADLDFVEAYTGNIHDERGRSFLSPRGNVTRGIDGGQFKAIGAIDDPNALKGYVTINGWNQYHIIARGPVLIHLINGHLMSVFLDEDTKNRAMEGVLGLQMHVGPPFKVEYRNVWYKKIS